MSTEPGRDPFTTDEYIALGIQADRARQMAYKVAELRIERNALEREVKYLRMCLNEILHFAPEFLTDEGGNQYVPGWLQNSRDAAAGKVESYPEL